MKVLAVDHGERRLGVAVSDATGRLARPLAIIQHESRELDARRVAELAQAEQAELIVVGQSFDEEGRPNLSGRRAQRFSEVLARLSLLRVVLWDESLSSQDASQHRLASGISRKRRARAIDAAAAAVILQSYLDAHTEGQSTGRA
ncbi:MAG TPA: Holliday junction resolvase RuvX [Anaerolineales bacterium]|nr:Holliday junction resolvase RuvX [Anaerolineales bacterium]